MDLDSGYIDSSSSTSISSDNDVNLNEILDENYCTTDSEIMEINFPTKRKKKPLHQKMTHVTRKKKTSKYDIDEDSEEIPKVMTSLKKLDSVLLVLLNQQKEKSITTNTDSNRSMVLPSKTTDNKLSDWSYSLPVVKQLKVIVDSLHQQSLQFSVKEGTTVDNSERTTRLLDHLSHFHETYILNPSGNSVSENISLFESMINTKNDDEQKLTKKEKTSVSCDDFLSTIVSCLSNMSQLFSKNHLFLDGQTASSRILSLLEYLGQVVLFTLQKSPSSSFSEARKLSESSLLHASLFQMIIWILQDGIQIMEDTFEPSASGDQATSNNDNSVNTMVDDTKHSSVEVSLSSTAKSLTKFNASSEKNTNDPPSNKSVASTSSQDSSSVGVRMSERALFAAKSLMYNSKKKKKKKSSSSATTNPMKKKEKAMMIEEDILIRSKSRETMKEKRGDKKLLNKKLHARETSTILEEEEEEIVISKQTHGHSKQQHQHHIMKKRKDLNHRQRQNEGSALKLYLSGDLESMDDNKSIHSTLSHQQTAAKEKQKLLRVSHDMPETDMIDNSTIVSSSSSFSLSSPPTLQQKQYSKFTHEGEEENSNIPWNELSTQSSSTSGKKFERMQNWIEQVDFLFTKWKFLFPCISIPTSVLMNSNYIIDKNDRSSMNSDFGIKDGDVRVNIDMTVLNAVPSLLCQKFYEYHRDGQSKTKNAALDTVKVGEGGTQISTSTFVSVFVNVASQAQDRSIFVDEKTRTTTLSTSTTSFHSEHQKIIQDGLLNDIKDMEDEGSKESQGGIGLLMNHHILKQMHQERGLRQQQLNDSFTRSRSFMIHKKIQLYRKKKIIEKQKSIFVFIFILVLSIGLLLWALFSKEQDDLRTQQPLLLFLLEGLVVDYSMKQIIVILLLFAVFSSLTVFFGVSYYYTNFIITGTDQKIYDLIREANLRDSDTTSSSFTLNKSRKYITRHDLMIRKQELLLSFNEDDGDVENVAKDTTIDTATMTVQSQSTIATNHFHQILIPRTKIYQQIISTIIELQVVQQNLYLNNHNSEHLTLSGTNDTMVGGEGNVHSLSFNSDKTKDENDTVKREEKKISSDERRIHSRIGQKNTTTSISNHDDYYPSVVILTGLPGSGTSTLANMLFLSLSSSSLKTAKKNTIRNHQKHNWWPFNKNKSPEKEMKIKDYFSSTQKVWLSCSDMSKEDQSTADHSHSSQQSCLNYGALLNLYQQVIYQLTETNDAAQYDYINSRGTTASIPSLDDRQSTLPILFNYIAPCNRAEEIELMNDLKEKMMDWWLKIFPHNEKNHQRTNISFSKGSENIFSLSHIIIVLDGLKNLVDLEWFVFSKNFASKKTRSKSPGKDFVFIGPTLLVTFNTVKPITRLLSTFGDNMNTTTPSMPTPNRRKSKSLVSSLFQSKMTEIIQITPLNRQEVITLFLHEAGLSLEEIKSFSFFNEIYNSDENSLQKNIKKEEKQNQLLLKRESLLFALGSQEYSSNIDGIGGQNVNQSLSRENSFSNFAIKLEGDDGEDLQMVVMADGDTSIQKVLYEQCRCLPMQIRLIGKFIRERQFLYGHHDPDNTTNSSLTEENILDEKNRNQTSTSILKGDKVEDFMISHEWWDDFSSYLYDETIHPDNNADSLSNSHPPSKSLPSSRSLVSESSATSIEPILKLMFSPVLFPTDRISDLVRQCFSSLIILFYDSSYYHHFNFDDEKHIYNSNNFGTGVGNDSNLVIPWTIVSLLWGRLLSLSSSSTPSKLKNAEQQEMLRRKQEYNFDRFIILSNDSNTLPLHDSKNKTNDDDDDILHSSIIFVKEQLEALGLIQSVRYQSLPKSSNSSTPSSSEYVEGIYIPYEAIKSTAESFVLFHRRNANGSDKRQSDRMKPSSSSVSLNSSSSVSSNSSQSSYSFNQEFDTQEREWNLLFIQAYERKFKLHGMTLDSIFSDISDINIMMGRRFNQEETEAEEHEFEEENQQNTLGKMTLGHDEASWLLQNLLQHLVLASSYKQKPQDINFLVDTTSGHTYSFMAAKLLANRSFVRNRLDFMGIVNGTKQHILDCESLMEFVFEKEEKLEEQEHNNRTINIANIHSRQSQLNVPISAMHSKNHTYYLDPIRAKSSVIIAYEQVQDYILEYLNAEDNEDFDDDDDDTQNLDFIVQAGFVLYSLGYSLQVQGWRNEAFMVYDEAIDTVRHALLLVGSNYGVSLNDESIDKQAISESTSNIIEDQYYDKKIEEDLCKLLTRIHNSVGLVHTENKATLEAIKSFSEGITYSKTFSDEILSGNCLFNLGKSLLDLKDYDSALDALNKALKVRTLIADGSLTLDRADTIFLIGKVQYEVSKNRDKDDYVRRAMKSISEALHIRRYLLGNIHSEVAHTLNTLGDICRENGDSEAIRIFAEAEGVWKELYNTGSNVDEKYGSQEIGVQYAYCLHTLGVLYRRFGGNLDESMDCYQAALQLRRRHLGSYHVDVAQTYHNIGIVYCEKGEHNKAMRAYAQALRVREELLGVTSADFSNTLHNIGVVLRQKGHTDEARKAFMEAMWIAKALDVEPPPIEEVNRRCIVLFGDKILDYECLSSRLFACASLLVDQILEREHVKNMKDKPEPQNTVTPNSAPSFMDWIRPIFPLLKAFVDAEIIVLESEDNCAENKRYKKISFCSFDISTTSTPVDIVLNSQIHLEKTVHAIENVLQEINHLTSLGEEEDNSENGIDNEITNMLLVFHAMSDLSEGGSLRETCAATMHVKNKRNNTFDNDSNVCYPSSRFIGASQLYKNEFEAIIARIESKREASNNVEENSINSHFNNSKVISTHYRQTLCVHISSAIRFHMRRLFDPVPYGYTIASESNPAADYSKSRARTHEVVWMAMPDGADSEDSKLAEAPMSYVFLFAIRRINVYMKNLSSSIKSAIPEESNTFCLTQASVKCLSTEVSSNSKDYGSVVQDNDVDDILYDISIAQNCLSAWRAAEFILSLMKWDGVKEAIHEAGGWQPIETFATIFDRHKLQRDCPEESHFVLLRDMNILLKQLEKEKVTLTRRGFLSQNILHEMWKRFQRGSKKKYKDTSDNIIYQALTDGSSNLVLYPLLAEPEYEAMNDNDNE